jgi:uncharacterized lipoprotein
MTKTAKLIFLGTISAFLAACASHHEEKPNYDVNTAYKTAHSSIDEMNVPNTMNGGKIQNDYPVPPVSSNSGDVSLIPPGSNIPSDVKSPSAQQTISNAPAPTPSTASIQGNQLTVNKSMQQAWPKTGQVLKSSGYSIVEQDSSMSTYYIADKASSGGSLKKDTPIYQVHLQPSNDGTNIMVLNAQNQPANPAVANRILGTLKNSMN